MCNYRGYEFGGVYLDSVCIDGYLWDEDSYDDGYLTNGGDEPIQPAIVVNGHSGTEKRSKKWVGLPLRMVLSLKIARRLEMFDATIRK